MTVDRTIQARVRYLNPEWRDAEEVPRIGNRESRHANTAYRAVTIGDARAAPERFELDTAGFTLTTLDTDAAGTDRERARAVYHPQVLDLVKRATGAVDTHLLGDLVRTEDRSNFNTAYARFVHCDFHRDNLQEMSTRLLRRNGIEPDPDWTYAWINTWQPFENTVEQNALAMLDVRSLAPGDLIAYRYTGYDDANGGLVSAPVHNPEHRWWYYPDMAPGEILMTKQLEGRPGRASQCPHTSFIDPGRADDVPPRRSIETRILAVFAA